MDGYLIITQKRCKGDLLEQYVQRVGGHQWKNDGYLIDDHQQIDLQHLLGKLFQLSNEGDNILVNYKENYYVVRNVAGDKLGTVFKKAKPF